MLSQSQKKRRNGLLSADTIYAHNDIFGFSITWSPNITNSIYLPYRINIMLTLLANGLSGRIQAIYRPITSHAELVKGVADSIQCCAQFRISTDSTTRWKSSSSVLMFNIFRCLNIQTFHNSVLSQKVLDERRN